MTLACLRPVELPPPGSRIDSGIINTERLHVRSSDSIPCTDGIDGQEGTSDGQFVQSQLGHVPHFLARCDPSKGMNIRWRYSVGGLCGYSPVNTRSPPTKFSFIIADVGEDQGT